MIYKIEHDFRDAYNGQIIYRAGQVMIFTEKRAAEIEKVARVNKVTLIKALTDDELKEYAKAVNWL